MVRWQDLTSADGGGGNRGRIRPLPARSRFPERAGHGSDASRLSPAESAAMAFMAPSASSARAAGRCLLRAAGGHAVNKRSEVRRAPPVRRSWSRTRPPGGSPHKFATVWSHCGRIVNHCHHSCRDAPLTSRLAQSATTRNDCFNSWRRGDRATWPPAPGDGDGFLDSGQRVFQPAQVRQADRQVVQRAGRSGRMVTVYSPAASASSGRPGRPPGCSASRPGRG
jgi:hypothetical protein